MTGTTTVKYTDTATALAARNKTCQDLGFSWFDVDIREHKTDLALRMIVVSEMAKDPSLSRTAIANVTYCSRATVAKLIDNPRPTGDAKDLLHLSRRLRSTKRIIGEIQQKHGKRKAAKGSKLFEARVNHAAALLELGASKGETADAICLNAPSNLRWYIKEIDTEVPDEYEGPSCIPIGAVIEGGNGVADPVASDDPSGYWGSWDNGVRVMEDRA